jgi:hypothetical protein
VLQQKHGAYCIWGIVLQFAVINPFLWTAVIMCLARLSMALGAEAWSRMAIIGAVSGCGKSRVWTHSRLVVRTPWNIDSDSKKQSQPTRTIDLTNTFTYGAINLSLNRDAVVAAQGITFPAASRQNSDSNIGTMTKAGQSAATLPSRDSN